MFLKNRNISSKIKRSKVTDYAALRDTSITNENNFKFSICILSFRLAKVDVDGISCRTNHLSSGFARTRKLVMYLSFTKMDESLNVFLCRSRRLFDTMPPDGFSLSAVFIIINRIDMTD